MGLSDSKFKGFKGKAKPITENDIAVAAKSLGVKWSRLHGVMEVEASFTRPGQGFDSEGRPKILFEPHHFYRALKIRKPEALAQAQKLDLARVSQPPRSWYGNKSYWRLVQALEIDEVSALLACSWGFGQVMGFNWGIAGFRNVQDMVFQCMDSEAAHLKAMCGYIKNMPACLNGLRTGNAAQFASGYNGANYAAGGYHTKIAAAWQKWERKPFPRGAILGGEIGDIEPHNIQEDTDMPAPRNEEALPPELEPKGQLSSTTIQGVIVSVLFKLVGAFVTAKFPNLTGTWENWALIMTPYALSLVGDAMAYLGTLGRTAPIKGTRGERQFRDALDEIIENQGAAMSGATDGIRDQAATYANAPTIPGGEGPAPQQATPPPHLFSELIVPNIKRMPLEDLVTQLPEALRLLSAIAGLASQVQGVQAAAHGFQPQPFPGGSGPNAGPPPRPASTVSYTERPGTVSHTEHPGVPVGGDPLAAWASEEGRREVPV